MSSSGSRGSGGSDPRGYPPVLVPPPTTPDGFVVLRFFPTVVGLLAIAYFGLVCGEWYRDRGPGRRGGAQSWGDERRPPPNYQGPAGFFSNPGRAPSPDQIDSMFDEVNDQYKKRVAADQPAGAFCLLIALAEEVSYLPHVPEHQAAWIMDATRASLRRLMEARGTSSAPDGKPWMEERFANQLGQILQEMQPTEDPPADLEAAARLLQPARDVVCALAEREKSP